MTVEEFIQAVEGHRDKIVKINKIKRPEYDPYINGWDDCIDFLYNHISDIEGCLRKEAQKDES